MAGEAVIIVVIVIVMILVVVFACVRRFCCDKRITFVTTTPDKPQVRPRAALSRKVQEEKVNHISPSLAVVVKMPFSMYTFEQLESATNGFSRDNLLGEGGFGVVYKGILDRMEVAVKKLKVRSNQGDLEFKAEVEIISRVHHKNLVSLIGYSISMNERLLVFEFLPNRTLDVHLRGKDQQTLNWQQRRKIALGSAKGLAYLHEDCDPKIIHRDIKAANIILNFNFEPKVADFGLAKLKLAEETHVSTRIMGTFGYIAPEFVTSGRLTEKADVYAFGVILLELITGKPPVWSTSSEQVTLVGWARPLLTRALEEGHYEQLIDPKLGMNYEPYEMAHMIECAASSVRQSARRRPLMSQIVQKLQEGIVVEDINDVTMSDLSSFNTDTVSHDIKWPRPGRHDYISSEFSDHSNSQNPTMSSTYEMLTR